MPAPLPPCGKRHSPRWPSRSVRDPSAPPLRARHAIDSAVACRTPRRTARDPRWIRSRLQDQSGDSRWHRQSAPQRTGEPHPDGEARSRPLPTAAPRRRSPRRSCRASGRPLNGRLRPALLFGDPHVGRADRAARLVAQSHKPAMLIAKAIAPTVLGALLVLNVAILAWRAPRGPPGLPRPALSAPPGPARRGRARGPPRGDRRCPTWSPGTTASRPRRCSARSSRRRPSVRFRARRRRPTRSA